MPKKIQNFARSALVKPVTVNVGRAGAANLDVVQEVEYVKQEEKMIRILSCLQKTAPPVRALLSFVNYKLITVVGIVYLANNCCLGCLSG